MNTTKQTEKQQDSSNVRTQQSNKQSDCNFSDDYYGDKVCRPPLNQKK